MKRSSDHINIANVVVSMVVIIPLLISCKDDFATPYSVNNSKISFSVSEFSNWQTRSDDSQESVGRQYCGSIELVDEETGEKLYLHKYVEDGIHINESECASGTRSDDSNLIKSMDEIDEFYVYGAMYKDEWDEDHTMNFMNNEIFRKDNSGLWSASTDYLWPTSPNKTRFFAYYPAPDPSNNSYYNVSFANGHVAINYKSSVYNYGGDVVVASTDEIEGNPENTQNLNFEHILTAVKFEVSPDMISGEITNITLCNIPNSGTYEFSCDDKWTIGNGSTNFGYTSSDGIAISPFDEESFSLKSINTYLMIPQTLPSDSYITLKYIPTYTSTTYTLKSYLTDQEWKSGTTVTYVISASSISPAYKLYYDYLDNSINNFDQYGTTSTKSFTIKSSITFGGSSSYCYYPHVYYEFVEKDSNGTYTPIDKPSWIDFEENSRATNSNYFSININYAVNAMDGKPCGPVTKELQSRDQYAFEDSRQDLSKKRLSNIVNTANCYLIDAPGCYKFPTIYGNGITNDVDIIQNQYSGKFVDYKGNAIYKAEMDRPYDAVLLWEDVKDLISNVKIYDEERCYVYFDIKKENIAQGNAVIAVRDEAGNIMWSWHIWVTNKDLENDWLLLGQNKNKKTFKYYIGWCDPETYNYEYERETILHVYQTNELGTQIINEDYITIYQKGEGEVENPYYTWPAYQWGRKDPMRPIAYDTGSRSWSNKPVYSDEYSDVGSIVKETTDIQTSIQNPHIHYTSAVSGSDYCYWNTTADNSLWGYKTDSSGYKTIYDPSPAGYRVPAKTEARLYSSTSYLDYNVKSYYVNGDSYENIILYWGSDSDDDYYELHFPFLPMWYSTFGSLDYRVSVLCSQTNYLDVSTYMNSILRLNTNTKYGKTASIEIKGTAGPCPVRPVAE